MNAMYFLIIPIFVFASAILMYRMTGKLQFLKLDLVQFLYAFVISPVFFIWLKSFIFFLLRSELDLRLTIGEIFTLDTIFSVVFLYIYAFVVIHSLTKTFDLHKKRNPLLDVYEMSEYFHLDYSHLGIYLSGALLLSVGAISNLFFPLELLHVKSVFYSLISMGLLTGVTIFTGLWMYESPEPKFMRWVKLIIGFFFLVFASIYFIFDPTFSTPYILYWAGFSIFTSLVFLSLFAESREEKKKFWQRLPFQLNPIKIKYLINSGRWWIGKKIMGK